MTEETNGAARRAGENMASSAATTVPDGGFASGPLRVSRRNPRYFEDAHGHVVLLVGSHAAASMADEGSADPPPPFDFNAYLDALDRYNHNFVRLWTCQQQKFSWSPPTVFYSSFTPWQRTGPGNALDGKPKFDLTRFNPDYFNRLRERVMAAGRRGIYVSVMLFEGDIFHFSSEPWCWKGHPFNVNNNVNGLDGDPGKSGRGLKVLTLEIPAVTAVQEAYVSKVIETVGDLDNVLYEIANEAGRDSIPWQRHMAGFVRACEATGAKQHPIGMTYAYGGLNIGGTASNQDLFDSPVEWISPGVEQDQQYVTDPPAASGRKVLIPDTDHLVGKTPDNLAPWVWKSFCRGMNMLFMDDVILMPDEPWRNPVRKSMGYCRAYAERMDLASAVPCNDLASTKYCLSDRKSEFLVYVPEGPKVSVDLSAAAGFLNVEWFNPMTGEMMPSGRIPGGRRAELTCPFAGQAVLYLSKPPATR